MLSYLKRTYTYGSAGEEEVTCLEHKELADVAHQLVHAKEHIYGVPALYGMAVYVEIEMDVLHMGKALYRDKLAQYGRTIESLAEFPWHSFAAKALLEVAGGDVYSHGDSIVVAVGKARGDVLAQLVDAHHQLGFVVEPLGKVGDEEGLAALEDGRVGLHEYHRGLGQCGCSVEFSMVFGIVHAYADNLHR